jgi:FAD dependent oxidoreductase TIGR03364
MEAAFDDAIVGAGIIGLAHAYHLARRGRRVVVFERGERAIGASIRNFGMLWPIGQQAGEPRQLALRSVAIWRDVLAESGIRHEPTGSLHLAYREDELQVLREFVESAPERGYEVTLLDAGQIASRTPAVQTKGLLGGMWSDTEVCVDPRRVIAELPAYLARVYGVQFAFGTAVQSWEAPIVLAGGRQWQAKRLYVCTGDDMVTLFPGLLQKEGLIRCKLQMLRSEPMPNGLRLGPMLAAGLTLRHYRAFEDCPSLPALKQRVAAETPEYDRYGIHVMASQNGSGELTLGDSHEYGEPVEPFDKDVIDALILDYLHTFLNAPGLRIASRWHGVYAKHPEKPYLILHPAPGAIMPTAVGGAGMTLSFGFAEKVVSETMDADI